MSKKWKVAIGVVVAVVIVCGIGLLHMGSMIYWGSGGEWGWSPAASIAELVWGPGASEYIPRFGRGLAADKGEAGTLPQLEVRLVDDNGDGVPDRGVLEVPAGLPFGQGFGLGHRPSTMLRTGLPFGPGHGLHFGRGFSPHFGRGFGPFLIVGGLFRLAFLVLLVGLAIVCFHRWRQAKATRESQSNSA